MQVLKSSVKNKILESARGEFLENGFNKASMRSISKKSDITVGNLYRYFKSKAVLFSEIIRPAYNEILCVIEEFSDVPTSEDDLKYFYKVSTKRILSIYREYSQELLILINGSIGTEYEETVNNLVEMILVSMRNYFKSMYELHSDITLPDDFILRIIAKNYLDGLTSILNNNLCMEDIEEKIRIFNIYMFKDFCFRFKED